MGPCRRNACSSAQYCMFQILSGKQGLRRAGGVVAIESNNVQRAEQAAGEQKRGSTKRQWTNKLFASGEKKKIGSLIAREQR
jgi:hypothetical protein